MKYLVVLLFIVSCTEKKNNSIPPCETLVVRDTIIRMDTILNSDSIRVLRDTLNVRTKRLRLAEYKLEKVTYYVKIVDNKPSQITFLKGWIKRTLSN